MAKIKGALVIQLVKIIRSTKKIIYNSWLDEADWQVIHSTVYPSGWYSFDVFRNIVNAVAQVEAENNEVVIYKWGYDNAGAILERLYNNFIVEGSLEKTIETYMAMSRTFFDFGSIETTLTDETGARVQLKDFPGDFKAFYHMVRGWFTKVFELAGAKDVKSRYIEKSWAGSPATTIEYSWIQPVR